VKAKQVARLCPFHTDV